MISVNAEQCRVCLLGSDVFYVRFMCFLCEAYGTSYVEGLADFLSLT